MLLTQQEKGSIIISSQSNKVTRLKQHLQNAKQRARMRQATIFVYYIIFTFAFLQSFSIFNQHHQSLAQELTTATTTITNQQVPKNYSSNSNTEQPPLTTSSTTILSSTSTGKIIVAETTTTTREENLTLNTTEQISVKKDKVKPTQPTTTTSSNGLFLSNSNSKSQGGEQQRQQQATKQPPRLRPSIEEVASELSKKHLNLEHENWRKKQPTISALNKFKDASSEQTLSSPSPSPPSLEQIAIESDHRVEVLSQTSNQNKQPSDSLFDDDLVNTSAKKGQNKKSLFLSSSSNDTTSNEEDIVKGDDDKKNVEEIVSTARGVVAEEASKISNNVNVGSLDDKSTNGAQQQQPEQQQQTASLLEKITNNEKEQQYLHFDSISSSMVSNQAIRNSTSNNNNNNTQSHRRRKQSNRFSFYNQQIDANSEMNEILQCHQYLQQHHASPISLTTDTNGLPTTTGSNQGKSSFSNNQNQLPCSCEIRRHIDVSRKIEHTYLELENNRIDSTWLSCDNVQLIGSHFYSPISSSFPLSGNSFEQKLENSSSSSAASGESNNNVRLAFVTKFSQRDSGLQTLHSQKFHYLLLNQLKYIDLSNNRIRQIKIDVFHGLEDKLEYLNLENNLLGDSRVVFSETNTLHSSNLESSSSSKNSRSKTNTTTNNIDNNGISLFQTEEINHLKKLKWLSLKRNQISQLGSSVFIKSVTTPITTTSSKSSNSLMVSESKLEYLDLSENLLKLVPSDSIHLLNKLQYLNMRKNRITQLDQFSKFPKSLKYLDLSENLIKVIRHSDLIDLTDLIELNLSHNQLSRLDKTAFISSSLYSNLIISSLNSNTVSGHEDNKDNVGQDYSSKAVNGDHQQEMNSLLNNNNNQHLEQNKLTISSIQTTSIDDKQNIETSSSLINHDSSLLSNAKSARAKRNANERENEQDLFVEGEKNPDNINDDDDLDGEESGASVYSLTSNIVNGRITVDSMNSNHQYTNQFNSTKKLNLSHNYFENIPGDSLLKFSNLNQLDLSFNRIRKLDSNYLCSIYNLVDNLSEINLSGNLLSLNNQAPVSSQNNSNDFSNTKSHTKQLNRLFGCLQKLEKLHLSVNRLGQSVSLPLQQRALHLETVNEQEQDFDGKSIQQQEDRLMIKFGETFGSRLLNELDLSDNQLKQMPIIKQFSAQPSFNNYYVQAISDYNNITRNNNTQQQQQQVLNQWLSSRSYLDTLVLARNYIDRLDEHDFEHLFNLRKLDLAYNRITNVPLKLMKKFGSLEELSLEGNQIYYLEPLNELFERSITTLKSLNLANNRLYEWPKIIKQLVSGESDASSSLSNSAISSSLAAGSSDIHLYPNQFYQQQQQQQQQQNFQFGLEDLNLDGNLLTSGNVTALFDQLIHMKSLRQLNLNYNLLTRIKSEWFKFSNKNLKTLSFTGNKINTIDIGSFANKQVDELLVLKLDFNLLKELKRKTFDSMPKIREINLANNLIHTINSESFHQTNSLKILKLNNNKLTSWKCEYFSHLCNSISGNINADLASLLSISSFQQDDEDTNNANINQHSTSIYVSSLIELDLSHNSLSQLRANSISVHTKLIKLNLEHNKLSFIPHDLFKATTASSSTNRQIQLVSSLKYLNLAHNRIQTIDNINFRPLKNLLSLDLSYNELQTLGIDVVLMDSKNHLKDQANRKIIISNNFTNLISINDGIFSGISNNMHTINEQQQKQLNETNDKLLSNNNNTNRQAKMVSSSSYANANTNWPALNKLRHLNLSNNQLTLVNQSLISELNPFALLNLDLSYNYLDSDSLPFGFYTKISALSKNNAQSFMRQQQKGSNLNSNNNNKNEEQVDQNYDLIFTLKLESLNLSHNRLNEFPIDLLNVHYTSMESCNLAHNRIQNLIPNSNLMIQIKSLNLESNPLNRESNDQVLFEGRNVRYLNMAATRLYAIQQVSQIVSEQLMSSALSSSSSSSRHYNQRIIANQTSQLDLIRSINKPIEAPYVRHLNLSSNQLVWLAANVFDKMHSLQTLDLSNNQLTRLHILNNQLSHVSSTLEYLDLNSNLFTNIDSNDFVQLSKLKYLDLSNLLSLQKLNCKFISKLTSLKSLKMYNYPQLKAQLNVLLSTYQNYSKSITTTTTTAPLNVITKNNVTNNSILNSEKQQPTLADRMQRKIRQELIMSTIGKHCFRNSDNDIELGELQSLADLMYSTNAEIASSLSIISQQETKWFDLNELELEMFINNDLMNNNNNLTTNNNVNGFKIGDQLSQLLGPSTEKITLIGLNLTQLSDESLDGITSDKLKLKISYTSMTQLPLKQILNSVPKRTKLDLDFRNNNIQTIDTKNLQLLDDLQLNNQILQHGDHSTFKLSSNPIRCDCQTRPLWLWLNQRTRITPSLSLSQQSSSGLGEQTQSTTGNSDADNSFQSLSITETIGGTIYKFNNVAQTTSDMECYYPIKLRGKLTQYVYYNDLVCKSNTYSSSNGQAATTTNINRQSRGKKGNNETLRDLHYSIINTNVESSISGEQSFMDGSDGGGFSTTGEDGDYLDLESSMVVPTVKLTKFNKYPTITDKNSLYSLTNNPVVPFVQENNKQEEDYDLDINSKIGKRDQNSQSQYSNENQINYHLNRPPQIFSNPVFVNTYNNDNQQPIMSIQYNKYRPNTQQKHSHYNTFNTFDQIPFGRAFRSTSNNNYNAHQQVTKSSLLTDSDVFILTIMSIIMAIFCSVIIIVCFFKYKLDRTDKGNILDAHNKLFMAHAIHMNSPPKLTITDLHKQIIQQQQASNSKNSSNKSKSSTSSSATSSKSNSKKAKSSSSYRTKSKQRAINNLLIDSASLSHKLLLSQQQDRLLRSEEMKRPQILIPMSTKGTMAPTTNFLMRSPTIRRMHALATTNPNGWFRYSKQQQQQRPMKPLFFKEAPPGIVIDANGRPKRRLFIGNKLSNRTRLSTSHLASTGVLNKFKRMRKNNGSIIGVGTLPSTLAIGCPLHSFKIIERLNTINKNKTNNSSDLDSEGPEYQCVYCRKLLRSIQQTQVQYVIRSTQDESTSSNSSDLNSSSTEEQQKRTRSLPEKLANHEQNLHEKIEETTRKLIFSGSCDSKKRKIKSLRNETGSDGNIAKRSDEKEHAPDEPPCYIPPSLIRAIARQLDKQQQDNFFNNNININSNDNNEHNPSESNSRINYKSRDQQVRLMKTFGVSNNNNSINVNKANYHNIQQQQIKSQLPTVDVNGKFSYQTESQLDSPTIFNDDLITTTTTTTDNEDNNRRSMSVENRYGHHQGQYVFHKNYSNGVRKGNTQEGDENDIFILIQDGPPTTNTSQTNLTSTGSTTEQQYEIVRLDDESETTPVGSNVKQCNNFKTENNSAQILYDDECSHSSSPIAYGFMRTSPSNTTLSSQTVQTRYNTTRITNTTTNNNQFVEQAISEEQQLKNYNNNNNHQNYYVSRKRNDTVALVIEDNNDNNNSSDQDDQIIISRL